MATGARPFAATNMFALVDAVLHQPAPAVRTINPGVSPQLEALVVTALEKQPARRYQRARDFEADLRRLAQSGHEVAGPVKRRRSIIGNLGILAGVAIAGVAAWKLASPDPGPTIAAFSRRDWVLVADVAGDTEASRQATREALTLALQQSKYVNVLPRERIIASLQRMERLPDAPVDEATALQLCQRENARVLLSPAVESSATGWRVTVRALDAKGRLLFVKRTEIRSPAMLLASLDVLAGEVRSALGESLEQIADSRPLAQVTTHVTEALERYSRAVDQVARGNLSEAEASLSAALALDPEFAMAHFQLARRVSETRAGRRRTRSSRGRVREARKIDRSRAAPDRGGVRRQP